ncbi:MAG: UDP-N-acetylmuramate dehydrogenase [Gammaproteobacteria bacterium]|nr:UDP-N-acetylmuramate dehydrogenase [Gammaproteobacteria bacterium]
MKTPLQKILQEARDSGMLNGVLKFNESLSRYTTWRIGGEAECFYQPENESDLQIVLKNLPENTEVYWIGLGSNLLVRDGGFKGIIIYTNGVLNEFDIKCSEKVDSGNVDSGKIKNTECIVSAQAGVACAIFARKSANNGINGAEFLSGIPGTIGGALAMNAGAFGGETWRHVLNVKMINKSGDLIIRTPDEFNVSYRHVELAEQYKNDENPEWFVSGTFVFEQDELGLKESKQEIKRLLAIRAETQPTKQANAGSVFKNPNNDHAARLIEACDLKGVSINDAQVSPKHANFIINKGKAKASDVEALIDEIKETVLRRFEIKLETEVKIIGAH